MTYSYISLNMNCHKLTIRSATQGDACYRMDARIIIKYYRKKINEAFMGINGNSCYKTHCFLNANLTIIGEFGNSGKMDEHKSIE